MDKVNWVPKSANFFIIEKRAHDEAVCLTFYQKLAHVPPMSPGYAPLVRPIGELPGLFKADIPRPDIDAVVQQIREVTHAERVAAAFPGRNEPRNKYDREIVPGMFVDVYDVLRAFKVTSGAIAHAVKKLLAPGQRGVKTVRDDVAEARDSLNREIQQIDEWA